jgi:hypothetical protein
LSKTKAAYLLWHSVFQAISKTYRYTLGRRIDDLFIETIEMLATAAFLSREEKIPFVRVAIRKVDTIKLLLPLLWETKTLDNKKYITLSVPLEEIGKMAGGWYGQLAKQVSRGADKQNSSDKKTEEK